MAATYFDPTLMYKGQEYQPTDLLESDNVRYHEYSIEGFIVLLMYDLKHKHFYFQVAKQGSIKDYRTCQNAVKSGYVALFSEETADLEELIDSWDTSKNLTNKLNFTHE